ncbi:formate dehydrogenase [Clostridium formicaceticum]|nr:formate dehydrogenase [Clostridium formicaceticum]
MKYSRRDFLKISGMTLASLTFLGFNLEPIYAYTDVVELRIKNVDVVPSICPYCAVGCGLIIHKSGSRVINVEGDRDHPINRGSLCSKGAGLKDLSENPRRVVKPLYRAPGSTNWEEKDWEWMLDRIAKRIKETRDKNFVEKENGITVNRTEAIASLGGAALDNEECYAQVKLMRVLGLVYIEHQARI